MPIETPPVIVQIEERLVRRGLAYRASAAHIEVPPSDDSGFAVRLWLDAGAYRVSFDGWHETFQDAEDALNCFVFGLSDACRLEIAYRGKMPTKWTLQTRQDGAWVNDSQVGLLLVPFWKRKRVVYRQNRVWSLPTLHSEGQQP